MRGGVVGRVGAGRAGVGRVGVGLAGVITGGVACGSVVGVLHSAGGEGLEALAPGTV